ncbi:MAG: hypothetical protein M3186_04590 [Actinomycetota bacterium]|nr:hypothetical protein [Actinomycetota bacterium]
MNGEVELPILAFSKAVVCRHPDTIRCLEVPNCVDPSTGTTRRIPTVHRGDEGAIDEITIKTT